MCLPSVSGVAYTFALSGTCLVGLGDQLTAFFTSVPLRRCPPCSTTAPSFCDCVIAHDPQPAKRRGRPPFHSPGGDQGQCCVHWTVAMHMSTAGVVFPFFLCPSNRS